MAASNPPRYYYSHEEIEDTLRTHGISPATRLNQQAARVSPTPVLPVPPGPLSLSLVNSARIATSGAEMNATTVASGHLINITLVYTPPLAPTVGCGKAAPKKAKIIKMDNISLEAITCISFIKHCFATQGLAETFSPGTHSGPDFKLWWPGLSGGKTGALSIQNDHQFSIALEALLKKNKATTIINVEFDLDAMEGFRIKQIVPPGVEHGAVNGDEELAYGTRVPQLENFSDAAQLHGQFVIELKKRWPCQTHQGEHGEFGYCYVPASGEHTRLNMLRMKTWAAAMAAGDATKHEPPNVNVFDRARDGHISSLKAHGRTGPHPSTSRTVMAGDTSNVMTAFMAAMLPLIGGGISRKRCHEDSSSPDITPKHAKTTSTGISMSSPLPELGLELQACLWNFAELEGVDITPFEIQLRMDDYTPDIIPYVDDTELRKITGATVGNIIKFKRFCKEWSICLEAKRRSQLDQSPSTLFWQSS